MKTLNNFTSKDLELYKQCYGCKVFSPVDGHRINEVAKQMTLLPSELRHFYIVSNGLEVDGFRILPIFDPHNPKESWDSLERENNIATTKFSLDDELLKRFIVFAEIGGLHCGMYDRDDSSIWDEDDQGYHRTNLNLKEFIELNLKDASDQN